MVGVLVDVALKVLAVLGDETLHRPRSPRRKRADGGPLVAVSEVFDQVDVAIATLAVDDFVEHAINIPGALAARRALTTGLVGIETRDGLQELRHISRGVERRDGAGTEHRFE